MRFTPVIRAAGAAVVLVACLLVPACDEGVKEDVDLTMSEMRAAAQRRDGEAFANLLAPESFDYYGRLIKLALDGQFRQLDGLTITEKLDVIMMRHRCTRKELAPMDGRGWIVFAVNKGWYDGPNFDEESIYQRNVKLRGSTATLEVVYDIAQPLFTGEGSGKRLRDYFTFLKVEDRWLADWRGQSVLFERLVELTRQEMHVGINQVLMKFESKTSLKEVDRDILNKPMK